ncbi:MAG: hypothetical protein ACJAXW_003171 [Candidatus Azotimanducaceae bacterium]|jgi:hypothetical protein
MLAATIHTVDDKPRFKIHRFFAKKTMATYHSLNGMLQTLLRKPAQTLSQTGKGSVQKIFLRENK